MYKSATSEGYQAFMKKLNRLALLLAVAFGGVGFHLSAYATTRYILDFDGTITDDRSDLSSWRTPWILRRIDQLRNLLQPNPVKLDLPETVEVSYREYRELGGLLGKGSALISSLQKYELRPDPIHQERPVDFVPGFYAVDDGITFKYYRPSPRRQKSYLVDHLNEAEERAAILNKEKAERLGRNLQAREMFRWQGLAFPLLKKAMYSKYTVGDLVLMTARWHADWEYKKFFRELHAMNYTAFASGVNSHGDTIYPRVHSLQEPESLQFGRYGLGQRKAAVVQTEAAELLSRNLPKHSELSSDGLEAERGIRREVKTLIVAEDDPRYLDSIRKVLEALSSDLYYTHQIKFILLNTGQPDEVNQARWPWRWTVFHKGFGRPALPAELELWTGCEDMLSQ